MTDFGSPMPPPPPPPGPVAGGPAPTGTNLVNSAWAALRHDRELIWLPMLGAVVAVLATAPLVVFGVLLGGNNDTESVSPVVYVMGVLALFVGSIVATFFAVALAAGAHERMNGGDPTIKSSLAVAWRRKRGVIGWALLATTVGIVLRAIEERLRGFGTILRIFGEVAWALASFFVIPVIAANDVGAIDALKLSARTFKDRWGSSVRVQLRLFLFGLALAVGAAVAVFVVIGLANTSLALAVLVGIIAGVALIVAALVLSALSSYARVVLYRYAAGLPTPGFAPATIEASIRTRGRR